MCVFGEAGRTIVFSLEALESPRNAGPVQRVSSYHSHAAQSAAADRFVCNKAVRAIHTSAIRFSQFRFLTFDRSRTRTGQPKNIF